MKNTLETINRMRADGIIGNYAIGGAVGATFYLDPSATLDVDVFVTLPVTPGDSLLSLSPIYEYLTARGGRVEAEYIVIGDWPVQFLSPSDALEREAIEEAIQTEVEERDNMGDASGTLGRYRASNRTCKRPRANRTVSGTERRGPR